MSGWTVDAMFVVFVFHQVKHSLFCLNYIKVTVLTNYSQMFFVVRHSFASLKFVV